MSTIHGTVSPSVICSHTLTAWQAQGAVFDIVSLDVTAGDDVAHAHALLHCGTPDDLAGQPENRLRLTLGLRKDEGRRTVAHEHHSFPDASAGDG